MQKMFHLSLHGPTKHLKIQIKCEWLWHNFTKHVSISICENGQRSIAHQTYIFTFKTKIDFLHQNNYHIKLSKLTPKC